jgi:hypothetical protein
MHTAVDASNTKPVASVFGNSPNLSRQVIGLRGAM